MWMLKVAALAATVAAVAICSFATGHACGRLEKEIDGLIFDEVDSNTDAASAWEGY